MIVKVQRPIEWTGPTPPLLVYDQSRSYCGFLESTEELKSLIGERPKIYAEAKLDAKGRLEIIREVPEESW